VLAIELHPKKLAALFSISLECLTSRFSCSSGLIRADSSVDTPGAYPSSMSTWRILERTDFTPYPSCRATRETVPCSAPTQARRARTIRTTAAFSSRLYLRLVDFFPDDDSVGISASSSPRSVASGISGRFSGGRAVAHAHSPPPLRVRHHRRLRAQTKWGTPLHRLPFHGRRGMRPGPGNVG
jgi:hypothetical protein